MEENASAAQASRYGTLGVDVGRVGHWARLVFGLLLLVLVAVNLLARISLPAGGLLFFGQLFLYFLAIVVVYTGVYWFLGERGVLAHLSPWASTAIFVGPAFVVAWWDFLIEPITGIHLPGAFWLAMLAYIGLSFLLQWRLSYGGCEVVSLPILLFRKRYPTYCIPLVALDAVEKAVMDRKE